MWNDQEHLEAYFAVPCMGSVLHTLNIRLAPEQLVFVANHAKDRVVLVESTLVPVLAPVASQLSTVEAWIVVGDGDASALADTGRPVHRYHELLAAEEAGFDYPEPDELAAASMCYTSGTTGDRRASCTRTARRTCTPAVCTPSVLGLEPRDRALAIVPQFHASGWGLPYAAFLSGASLLMPAATSRPSRSGSSPPSGRRCRPRCRRCGPTSTATATTTTRPVVPAPRRLRGSALPRSLMERFQERDGLRLIQGWGMTEMSPVGAVGHPGRRPAEERRGDGLARQDEPRHPRRRAPHRRRRR